MEFEISDQLVPGPAVGCRAQALVQWWGGAQASATPSGWSVQGQGTSGASVDRRGKTADANVTEWGLRPTAADGAATRQPTPSPVRVVHHRR